MITTHRSLLLALLVLAGPAVGPAAAEEPLPDPDAPGLQLTERFAVLVERIKIEQSRLVSLEADFRQTKESQLLLEVEEAKGRFAYVAPDRARWEFTEPTRTLVVIRGEEMLTWYRDLGRAERLDVGRQADRVMQYLSASNSLETLQRYFTFQVAFPEDSEAPYRIDLSPRFSRVARRIAGMTIWLDRRLFVPSKLRIEEPDGDETVYEFLDYTVNGEVPEETFDPELPADVEVSEIALSGR